jgi:cobalamin biosynthetic protein CobC
MKMPPIIHGGDLNSASAHYDISLENWIDLSTGINPIPYPCNNIPQEAFNRLPYPDPNFVEAVRAYYGSHHYISLSGSQEVIQNLPKHLAQLPVILPTLGYQEHHHAWQASGNPIRYYDALNHSISITEISTLLKQNSQQHLVIINPNNPSGLKISIDKLLSFADMMEGNARLIIDEAFIDLHPTQSMLSLPKLPHNILVLRSCGKFFGLGGLRAGFLFGSIGALSALELPHNPWAINGIAQDILSKALIDRYWHTESLVQIQKNSVFLEQLFSPLGLELLTNQGLFISYLGRTNYVELIYETFAQSGILLRVIPVNSDTSVLRVGLFDLRHEANISRVRNCIEHAIRKPNRQL